MRRDRSDTSTHTDGDFKMNCNSSNCGCEGRAQAQNAMKTETTQLEHATFRPDVDIYETGEEFVLTADVPGARPESIDLNVEKGVLTLRAGVAQRGPSEARPVSREYGVGGFERTFRIGEGIDVEQIGAELKNGVLTLRLPKSVAKRGRKIEVKAS
jgi:HSP20 family protein